MPPPRSNNNGNRNRPQARRSSGPPRGIVTSRPAVPPPPPTPPKEQIEQKQKEDAIELEGVISAVLAGTMFRVKLKNGHEVLAHISGKMRKRFIRLVIGDGVKLQMSPYDMDKARIVYRL